MTQSTRSLEKLLSASQDNFAVMDRLANVLNKLSRVQTTTTPQATFKAPDFNDKEDVETFIQHFQEVENANEWSNTAALLRIRMHLQDDAAVVGITPTLEEVFKALRSKYGLSTIEARTLLTNIRRNTKL